MRAATGALEQADAEIATLRRDLREMRADFAPTFAGTVAPHRRTAAIAAIRAINELQAARAVLNEASELAANQGIELPTSILSLPDLRHLLPDLARLAGTAERE